MRESLGERYITELSKCNISVSTAYLHTLFTEAIERFPRSGHYTCVVIYATAAYMFSDYSGQYPPNKFSYSWEKANLDEDGLEPWWWDMQSSVAISYKFTILKELLEYYADKLAKETIQA
jgi:hypothetical protein